MRVLMISYTSLLQRAYRAKCSEICRQGDVDLTVLTPESWREAWSPTGRVDFEPENGREPYGSIRAPILFAGNGHISFFRRGLGRAISEVRPDVIDLEREPWSFASGQVLWLRRRHCPRARLVFHASQTLMKRYPPPFRQIEQSVFRRADAALARSEAAATVLRRRGFGGRVRVIPHGVDTQTFSPAVPPAGGDPVVGFVGALTVQKGVATLLEALARLGPGVRCVIVGDGPERGRLETLARKLGIGRKVEFAGALPHARIPAVLRGMSVFVLPAQTVPGCQERFGRVLAEAMATGLPVVGTDSGEIPNVIGDAGLVVPERDAEALARALGEIVADREKARALGARARHRVEENFGWGVVARRTLEVYREVLAAEVRDR